MSQFLKLKSLVKDKNYRKLAHKIVLLKGLRLLFKLSAYGNLFFCAGLLIHAILSMTPAGIGREKEVAYTIFSLLIIYWLFFAVRDSISDEKHTLSYILIKFFFQYINFTFFYLGIFNKGWESNHLGNVALIACVWFVLYLAFNELNLTFEKKYLFHEVIDRDYLCLNKGKDISPTVDNFYNDQLLNPIDLRMREINKKVIKPPYQKFVELSFIKETSAINLRYSVYNSEKKFGIAYHNYELFFFIYPFSTSNDFKICFAKIKLTEEDRKLKISQKKDE